MTRLNIPLFVALAASLLSAIDARDQLPHQRMIRKRGPAPLAHLEARAPAFVVPRWPGLVGRQDVEPSPSVSGSASASRSASASSSTSSAQATSTTQSSSAAVTPSSASSSVASTSSASSSSRGGLLDSLTAGLGGTQSSTSVVSSTSSSSSSSSSLPSTSSAAPSTSSAAQSSSQAPATSSTPQVTPSLNLATPPPSQANPTPSIALIYSTASASPAEQSQTAQKERTKKITRNTIISLVVIASCIGGAIAIWTVIRKWKLSPSERFDDRMQPIDWAPTSGGAGLRDDPLAEKASHRRAGSTGSHGSFTSGGVGQSEVGHGGAKSVYSDAAGHGNAQYGAQAQDFPPPHDFTAGTNVGGYGQYQGQQYAGAGYADLRRGPSVTESNYSHGTYSRGPAYEAQPGAAGVPPMPNPYGGYEEEYYQPAQGQTQTQGQGQYRGY